MPCPLDRRQDVIAQPGAESLWQSRRAGYQLPDKSFVGRGFNRDAHITFLTRGCSP